MAALLIGAEEKVRIKSLKDFAQANVISNEELMRRSNGFGEPIGDDPNYRITLPVGFRVVFTHEMQKAREARHISISHKGRLPPPSAVNMIIEEFGFLTKVQELEKETENQKAFIWIEEEVNAVNVMEFV